MQLIESHLALEICIYIHSLVVDDLSCSSLLMFESVLGFDCVFRSCKR